MNKKHVVANAPTLVKKVGDGVLYVKMPQAEEGNANSPVHADTKRDAVAELKKLL